MGFEFVLYSPPQHIHSLPGENPGVTSKHPNVFPAQVPETFLEHVTNFMHRRHKCHIDVIQDVFLPFCCFSNKVKYGNIPLRGQQSNNLESSQKEYLFIIEFMLHSTPIVRYLHKLWVW